MTVKSLFSITPADRKQPKNDFKKSLQANASMTLFFLQTPSLYHAQCDQIGRFIPLLGNFSKLVARIILPKSPHFCKCVKIFHFLVQSFLGRFYRHLATIYWSHWSRCLTLSLARPFVLLSDTL